MSNRKFVFSSVQILTTFALCLLFIQTVRITPFPFDGLAQQKEDFVYRDSDQVGGGIEESKMLRRDISPNDHRDGSRKNSLNRFHYRVTRDTHSCVKSNISVTICGDMMVFNVTCGDTSVDLIDGSYLSPHSRGIRIRKYFNGCGKVHVTGCRCNQ